MKIRDIISNLFGAEAENETDAALRQRIASAESEIAAITKAASAKAAISKETLAASMSDDEKAEMDEKRTLLAELKRKLEERTAWEVAVSEAPFPSTKQIRAVAQEAFFTVPEEAVKRLEAIQRQWEVELAEVNKYLPGKFKEAYRAHQAELEESILKGESLGARDGWGPSEFESEYLVKHTAHRNTIKRLSVQAHQLAKPFVEEFDRVVAEYAEQKELNERSMAQCFDLPFKPSNVLTLIHKVRSVIRNQFNTFSPTSGLKPTDVASIIQQSRD